MCSEIENRAFQPSLLKIEKPQKLYQQLINILENSCNQKILKTKRHEIHRLVKLKENPKTKEFEIVGGAKHFKRIKNLDSPDYLERVDGCWFDFSIMIMQSNQSVEIIGFDFEIRFPDDISGNVPVKFFRIDFNLPGHENEGLGMRFHLHPGNDDFMVHALPMSPIEIRSEERRVGKEC